MLTPEFARFELVDGAPVVRLLVEAPPEAATSGWGLLRRMTMCLIDGPGDAGYLIPCFGMEIPPGWDEAAERLAGTSVVFGDRVDSPRAFARSLDAEN